MGVSRGPISLLAVGCWGPVRVCVSQSDENGWGWTVIFFFGGGRDRLHFGKEMLLCAREVCSSHCPLAHTDTHYILTPSLKPISFAQGMGTPLLSLLPLSPLPPYHLCPLFSPLFCCPLYPSSLLLSIASSPCLALARLLSLVPLLSPRSSCPPLGLFSSSVFSSLVLFPASICAQFISSSACVFSR